MRALDTNILVRLFALDDPQQYEIATELIGEPFIVLPTVLVELVWVLQTSFGMKRPEISQKLYEFLGMENSVWPSESNIKWVVDQFHAGADFADTLHLALAAEVQATFFATFDRGMNKISTPPIPIETLA